MENINKFYQDFMFQAQEDAEMNDISLEDALTENIIEYIKESNETNCPEILSIRPMVDVKNKDNFHINAFDYSDLAGELDIFVSLFKYSEKPETIQHNEIDSSINHGMKFLNLTISGTLSKSFRESKPEFAEGLACGRGQRPGR